VFRAFTGVFGLDPKKIFDSISPYGEVAAWLIVFAETGLLVGFFLPGDSLLFTAGVLAGQAKLELWLLIPGAFIAAVLGDQLGFLIGRHVGPPLFRRPDSRLFKQEYVERTHAFFEHHGPKAVVLARFVPIVRTFTPVMAGVGRMNRRIFTIYNVIGAAIWAVGVTMLGYALGNAIGSNVDNYLLPLIAVIIVISLLPAYFEWRRAKTRSTAPAGSVASDELAAPDERGDGGR
jgi:membrane-associated protein